MIVDALIDGPSDEAVARRLIGYCGLEFGTAYGKRGCGYLRAKAGAFNKRATYADPILMLVDFMDTGLRCPPEVPRCWVPNRCGRMLVRVAVREVESWLLADGQGVARYLRISEALIPRAPEQLPDPKQALVNLARRSHRKGLRDAMVPPPKLSSLVGPGYTWAIDEFVTGHWNIEAAIKRSPSLMRCVTRLGELHGH